ncbi:MAG: hypothetical protein AAGF76_08035, partial [Pseudomonadota bacterium]
YSEFPLHWIVDPYIGFFAYPGVSGVFYILLVSLALGWKKARRARWPLYLICFALLWLFFVNYVIAARPQPRYYGPAIVCLMIVTAYAIARINWPIRRLFFPAMALTLAVVHLSFLGAQWEMRRPTRQWFIESRALAESGALIYAPGALSSVRSIMPPELRERIIDDRDRPPGAIWLAAGPVCLIRGAEGDVVHLWTSVFSGLPGMDDSALRQSISALIYPYTARFRHQMLCLIKTDAPE